MQSDCRTLLKATAATGALAARQLDAPFAPPGPHSFSPVLSTNRCMGPPLKRGADGNITVRARRAVVERSGAGNS